MAGEFRKISRVNSLTGATKWYLNEDCLLAAKRVLYIVEYRRFYLRDLESIVVWPRRAWALQMLPGGLLVALGAVLMRWVNTTSGEIFGGLGLLWVGLEVALGPTARACILTTGARVEMPLVGRMRRAAKALAKIDAAIVAARGGAIQTPAVAAAAEPATGTGTSGAATAGTSPVAGDAG